MNVPPRSSRPRVRTSPGMTLIELTVVILVLLALIVILFVGASAWKRGSDRANCIMQIRQVQVAMRSFANLNGYVEGQSTSPVVLQSELIGAGKYLESTPVCPASGSYTFGGDTITTVGTLYMTCSLAASDNHEPESFAAW